MKKIFENKEKVILATIVIIVSILGGYVSSFLSFSQTTFYENIKLPFFAPPWWVFTPVWTILYALIGYGFYRLLENDHLNKWNRLIYIIGYLINLFWSYVFFTHSLFIWAAVMILGMLVISIYFIILGMKKDKKLAYSQIPYVMWLLFALALTIGVAVLN